MKRLVLVILVLILSIQQVVAGDLMYLVTHENQDALVIGEILEEIGDDFKIEVKQVVSGNFSQSTVTINKKFQYAYTHLEPAVGDYLILSLDKSFSSYYIKNGAFKADSGDYKTLILEKDSLNLVSQGDLTSLERYIHSNGEDNDFYFKESKVYLRKKNGADELIFPYETVTTFKLNKEVDDKIEKTESKTKSDNFLYEGVLKEAIVLSVAGVASVIIIYILKRK